MTDTYAELKRNAYMDRHPEEVCDGCGEIFDGSELSPDPKNPSCWYCNECWAELGEQDDD